MKLTDLNAPGGIGANCLLLQLDSLNIVIDAGLHPRMTGLEALPRYELLDDLEIDVIIVTHCHLDHIGSLPVLARRHPNTPVVISRDSDQYYKRMLRNSCTVMQRQRDELGIPEYPLFSYREVAACARQVLPVTPGQPRVFASRQGDEVTFTLFRSGHIPGAVGILFEYRHRRIFHSGDVLFHSTALLDGARFPEGDMDTIILETTRGATIRQASRADEMERLLECIRQTTGRGGSILIPVFALGRMQEMITVLHEAAGKRRLKRLPLFVSGLGVDLLNAFDALAQKNGHLRVRKRMLRQLGGEKLPVGHRAGSEGPAIYLVSSGMIVENTPSYQVASALLESHRNTVAFVGYCDPDTPGGQLQRTRQGETFLFRSLRKTVAVQAHIEKFDLSSHADREDLLEFALSRNPRSVVLTHGDPEARGWFQEQIAERDPRCRVTDPQPLRALTV